MKNIKMKTLKSNGQIYNTLILSYDNIKYFLTGVKFLMNNQKFLETNRLTNVENKMIMLKSYELKTILLESKIKNDWYYWTTSP